MATLFENKNGQSNNSFVVNLDQVRNIRYSTTGSGYVVTFIFTDTHYIQWTYPTQADFNADFEILKNACINR